MISNKSKSLFDAKGKVLLRATDQNRNREISFSHMTHLGRNTSSKGYESLKERKIKYKVVIKYLMAIMHHSVNYDQTNQQMLHITQRLGKCRSTSYESFKTIHLNQHLIHSALFLNVSIDQNNKKRKVPHILKQSARDDNDLHNDELQLRKYQQIKIKQMIDFFNNIDKNNYNKFTKIIETQYMEDEDVNKHIFYIAYIRYFEAAFCDLFSDFKNGTIKIQSLLMHLMSVCTVNTHKQLKVVIYYNNDLTNIFGCIRSINDNEYIIQAMIHINHRSKVISIPLKSKL